MKYKKIVAGLCVVGLCTRCSAQADVAGRNEVSETEVADTSTAVSLEEGQVREDGTDSEFSDEAIIEIDDETLESIASEVLDYVMLSHDSTQKWDIDAMNSYTVVLDGDTYTLPFKTDELTANGWELTGVYANRDLEPSGTCMLELTRGGKALEVEMRNFYNTAQKASDCHVHEILCTDYGFMDQDAVITFSWDSQIETGQQMELHNDCIDYKFSDVYKSLGNSSESWSFHEWRSDQEGYDAGSIMLTVEDGVLTQLCVTCDVMGSGFTGEFE